MASIARLVNYGGKFSRKPISIKGAAKLARGLGSSIVLKAPASSAAASATPLGAAVASSAGTATKAATVAAATPVKVAMDWSKDPIMTMMHKAAARDSMKSTMRTTGKRVADSDAKLIMETWAGETEGNIKSAFSKITDRYKNRYTKGTRAGGFLNVAASMTGAGIFNTMLTDKDQRGVGSFVRGAAAGGVVGGLGTSFLRSGFMSGVAHSAMESAIKRNSGNGALFSYGALKMASSVESASARRYAFGTGAMLGGALFGGSSNKRRGLNANRGNRF